MKKFLLTLIALVMSIGMSWADKTVYFNPSFWQQSGTDAFGAYVFGGSEPATWVAMTEFEGTGCYKLVVDDSYTGLLFTRAENSTKAQTWDETWNQTIDLNIGEGFVSGSMFTITDWNSSTWWKKDGDEDRYKSTATSSGTAVSKYTARFATGLDWTNKYAYLADGEWNALAGSWPGSKMTPIDQAYGLPVYSVAFLAAIEPTYIIFNDGTGGTVGTAQTANLAFTDDMFYAFPGLPTAPTFDANRVITITGYYTDKVGVYGEGGLSFTNVAGRNVFHVEEPTVDSRIEGLATSGLAAKQMEKLHVAIWAKESVANAKIKVYSWGWQSKTVDLTGGAWNVFDIPIDGFSNTLSDVTALKVVNSEDAALGTEIYITDVFFYNEGAKPMLNASLGTITGTSVSFKLSSYKSTSATADNISYTIAWEGDSKIVNKENGDEFTETVDGLTTGTTYNFSITAKDNADVVSNAIEFTVTPVAEPTTVPVPTKDNADVATVYSQTYGDVTGLTFAGDWTNTEEIINEKKTRKIEKLVWGNLSFASQDVSEMEKLHFDIYPMQAMPQIGLRVQGVGLDSHYKKTLTAGEWNSFDIDLSEDLGLTTAQLEGINNIQIVSNINNTGGNINGDGTGSFYIGNVYFWKQGAAPVGKTVSFINTGNWEKVYVHAYGTGGWEDDLNGWPGDELTNNGDGTFTWNTTLENIAYIIFGNGTDPYTNAFEFVDGATYNPNGRKFTASFKNSVGWDNVKAFTYDDVTLGDWPGTDMTKDGDIYTIEFFAPSASAHIIFSNGNGGNGNQTANLDFVDGQVYDMAYYVVGSMNGWTVGDADYKMTLNTKSATKEFKLASKDLAANEEIKVVLYPDYEGDEWYPAGSNPNYVISDAGNYNIYFRPNADGGDDWHYHYIKAASTTELIDEGVGKSGAHVLAGPWDGGEFGTLDASVKATSYDLTNLAATFDGGEINTTKKNALFIARADQNIGKNKVVDNGDGTYTGTNINILDYNEYNGQDTEMNTQISPITGTINYHRTLPAANIYFTQVIPFTMAVPANITAYEATTSTSSAGVVNVTFSEVTTMQAGVPYLLTATDAGAHFLNATSLDFSAGSDANLTDCAFKATYAPVNPVPANTYVVAKGSTTAEFRLASTGSYIPAFRAYLQLNDPAAKINVLIDDATGIHSASADMLNALFNIYSIDGKVVRHNADTAVDLPKGVYIINGKKVVVK